MEITKLDEKSIERFIELKNKTFAKCSNVEKKEYSILKPFIKQYRPELLSEELPVVKNTEVLKDIVDVKPKDNGLTTGEKNILLKLNEGISGLNEDEKRQRNMLRNKVREFKLNKMREELTGKNIELGDTLEELVWIVSVISQGLAPQLFKNVSAAGLDSDEIKLMHHKAKLLNEKING